MISRTFIKKIILYLRRKREPVRCRLCEYFRKYLDNSSKKLRYIFYTGRYLRRTSNGRRSIFKAQYCHKLKNDVYIISPDAPGFIRFLFFAYHIEFLTSLSLMLRLLHRKYYCTSNNVTNVHFSLGVLVTICSADATRRSLKLTTFRRLQCPHGTLFVVRFHFANAMPLRPQPHDLLHAIVFFVSLIFFRLSITHSHRAAFFIVK